MTSRENPSMTDQMIDILEKKIEAMVVLITRLKTENRELRSTVQEMTSKLKENQEQIKTLQNESERFEGAQIEINSFKERENRIGQKVEALLKKLQEFKEIE
jgi:hypothetical protein